MLLSEAVLAYLREMFRSFGPILVTKGRDHGMASPLLRQSTVLETLS